jgi:hypothetical protein
MYRRRDAVQFSWLDTREVGQLLFNRAVIAREDSKCDLLRNIWDENRRTGLAAKIGQGY